MKRRIVHKMKVDPPALLLAQTWSEKVDPTGWYISEKLDGVRGYWNGTQMVSRLGNVFEIPDWFLRDFPSDMCLDGELFAGRENFQDVVGIVHSGPDDPRWKNVVYHVFDIPSLDTLTFDDRVVAMKRLKGKYLRVVKQTRCKGTEHVIEELSRAVAEGAEGLMLRNPSSLYEGKRSASLLKVKKCYDAEAIVIAHETGKGRNAGRVGALKVRMANGNTFCVGSGLTDKLRDDPPPIGSIITYHFFEYSRGGIPRFPTFGRIRPDVTVPSDFVMKP